MAKTLLVIALSIAAGGGTIAGAVATNSALQRDSHSLSLASAHQTEPVSRSSRSNSVLVLNGHVVHGDADDAPPPSHHASKPHRTSVGSSRVEVDLPRASAPAPARGGSAGASAGASRSEASTQRADQAVARSVGTRQAGRSPRIYRVAVERSITYAQRGDTEVQLDVWYPRGRTSAATIVLVHGGGWRTSSRREWDAAGWVRRLVHRGYVVVTPGYRIACDATGTRYHASRTADPAMCGFTLRESIDDVRTSVSWTKSNVASWGGDPNRVVVLGASAGAHLALMAGADTDAARGVVALSPPSDLTWFGHRPREIIYDAVLQALGCSWRQCEKKWRGLSPVTLAEHGASWPNTYLYDSDADRVTPGAQNDRLVRVLRTRGVDVTRRHPVPRGSHCHGTTSCSRWPVEQTGRMLLDDVDAWIRSQVGQP